MPDADTPQLDLIAANLPTIVPGAVVVDRGLQLGAGRDPGRGPESGEIDLAAVDGEGRLLLVCQVTGDGADGVLLTLDALAFARKNLPLLAHHFRDAGLSSELSPLVVLVAESFEPQLLARLGGLDPSLLACLEFRRLSSRERQETYLVPVVPSAGAEPPRQASRPSDFLQHLSPDLRPVGERLLERLVRIDEDLTSTSSGRQMSFALNGEPICVLRIDAEGLEARVVPDGGSFRVSSHPDVDAFLEDVLQRTLELFEPRTGGGSLLAPPDTVLHPHAFPASLSGEPAARELDPMLPSGSILTPEEIEAFRSMH